MERLDKIISSQENYSRKDAKKIISQGKVKVDGKVIKNPETKIDKQCTTIYINDKKILIKEHIYIVLNKPKGYISATEDREKQTVLDLIPKELYRDGLFPAGRLDKDTTGLMIITDDGVFAHKKKKNKKHVNKTYEVEIDIKITQEMIDGFKTGVKLNDGMCKPAGIEKIGEKKAIVTLSEGRYHQIKRMFGCFGAKVIELNRIAFGEFYLPKGLKQGKCRELTEEEVNLIQKRENERI